MGQGALFQAISMPSASCRAGFRKYLKKVFFDANRQLIKMQAGGKFRQDDLEIIENSAINRDRFVHLLKELFTNFFIF